MKQFVLSHDDYESLLAVFTIALSSGGNERMNSEIKDLETRIQLIAKDCSDPYRAGQVDIIRQIKDVLEIES
jgi:hypothetical protein